MFFCEKCNYIYNITKDVKTQKQDSKIGQILNNFFEKISKGLQIEINDLDGLSGNDILNDERFENTNQKNQKSILSAIKNIDKTFFANTTKQNGNTTISYFICKQCKFSTKIKPGTTIYTKVYNANLETDTEDYTYAKYDSTLLRTKNYICKNKECKSHNNSSTKEAVLTKNNVGQIVYVCTICSNNWSGAY